MILQFYGESNFTGYSNVSFDLTYSVSDKLASE